MRILRALDDALFRPSTQQSWPQDRKVTQSCWCLHWFLGLLTDVWKIFLQVRTRPVVTQVYIEKMFNKNIEIGFQVSECSFSPLQSNSYKLGFLPLYFYLGRSYSSDRYLFCGKRPLAIVAMNASCLPLRMGNTTPKVRLPSTGSVLSPDQKHWR